MPNISLQKWISVLSESGLELPFRPDSLSTVELALQRSGIEVDPEDLATLGQAIGHPVQPEDKQRRFAVSVFHHPMLNIPSRSTPGGVASRSAAAGAISGTTPLPHAATLPPWGQMEAALEAALADAVIPIDWAPGNGEPPTPDNWSRWRDQLAAEISFLIWPSYERKSEVWDNVFISKLLDADFRLLADLRGNLEMPIKGIFPTTVLHDDLFTDEDDGGIHFGAGYERYDATLTALQLKSLPTIFASGIANKVGTLDLQLKRVFQRPRAHQVAFLQQRKDFSYRWARTGNTPSMVSGHCLQASLGGCAVYSALGNGLNEASVKVLQQFTVDVGDRRVFAGVHYPSDNLASWFVALRLIPQTFGRNSGPAASAKRFLWEAIDTGSLVFDAAKRHAATVPDSPYAGIIEEIRRIAKS